MPQQPCRGVFAGLQGPNRANRGRTGWSKWACLRARHRDRQRYHDFRDRSEAQTGSARPITILARMAFWFGAASGMGGDRRDREGGGLGALFMLIFAPFAAMLIQLWVSRTREYEADATGAHLTGNPYALASALEKISASSRRVPLVASPTSAHLFIVQPLLSGQTFASLFSTHPPIEKRIERLIGRPSVYGSLQ